MIHERWSEVDISTYLDGQLAPDRLAVFEKSLAQNSVLRQRVDALRKTLALLHETPLRESPRNYLLSPSMVANPKPVRSPQRRSFRIMRVATSLTAAAFVLTIGLNVLTRRLVPAAVMQSRESLEFIQSDNVSIQEVEAPALKLADATPTWETEDAQEKALIEEEPAMEFEVEAPLPEGEMKVAPVSEIEVEEATGIGGGDESPDSPAASESLDILEGDGAFDAAEAVEQDQVLMGEAADGTDLSEQAPDEDDDLAPKEDIVDQDIADKDMADQDIADDEAILAAPSEEAEALDLPEEQGDDTPRGMVRQPAWFPLPQWVPISLGIMTLFLLGATLLQSDRRK